MQAHSLSKPAARDSLLSTGFDDVTLSKPMRHPVAPIAISRTAALSPSTATLPPLTPVRARRIHVEPALGMAHDARNLIAAMGLYCDLLDRPGVLQHKHRHYAVELRHLTDRSGRLMRQALADPASSDLRPEDTLQPSQSPADPAAILRELAPLLSAIAAPAATVSVKVPRLAPAIALPEETLERIVVNLVRNAAQAIELAFADSGHGGHIRVALATLADHLQLTVEDNGPGMPVAVAAAFLSPSPLPRGAQHGLGHRIVHDLVTSSGGKLTVRVRPGRGTVFCIKWPMPSPSGPSLRSVAGAHPGAGPC